MSELGVEVRSWPRAGHRDGSRSVRRSPGRFHRVAGRKRRPRRVRWSRARLGSWGQRCRRQRRWRSRGEHEVAEAVAQIAAPQSVDARVAEGVAETRIAQEELAKADRPLWWWVDPLAWRLEAHSDAQASVAEWTTTVRTAHGVAVPQSTWMTVTVDLEWVESNWRVAAIGIARPDPDPESPRRALERGAVRRDASARPSGGRHRRPAQSGLSAGVCREGSGARAAARLRPAPHPGSPRGSGRR